MGHDNYYTLYVEGNGYMLAQAPTKTKPPYVWSSYPPEEKHQCFFDISYMFELLKHYEPDQNLNAACKIMEVEFTITVKEAIL